MRLPKRREVEDRGGGAPLPGEEGREHGREEGEEGQYGPGRPAEPYAEGEREQEGDEAEAEGRRAERVERSRGGCDGDSFLEGDIAPQAPEYPYGDVDVEDPAPARDGKDEAAEQGARDAAQGPGDAVDAQGAPALVRAGRLR